MAMTVGELVENVRPRYRPQARELLVAFGSGAPVWLCDFREHFGHTEIEYHLPPRLWDASLAALSRR